ncbi:MAG: glutamate synthase [Christensenellales bacterium]|jgi:glutamate synthase domain-containing protein 3
MTIDAQNLNFSALNQAIRGAGRECKICGCRGQRFIASGMRDKSIEIDGVPGNALGAYLGGASITVNGNAQDAVGDTMNAGRIVIHGNIGDAAGYAMRGGEIYIKGNAGYRAGIHMKEYREKKPVIVIGGRAGSFLGEYQAGGIIIVLGLHTDGKPIVGNFPCTGMHGGKMVLRGDVSIVRFPGQTTVRKATKADMAEVSPFIRQFCEFFGFDTSSILGDTYTAVTPDSKNPYKQMYVEN